MSSTDVSECGCGHTWEYHGPEVPGCVECTCRQFHDAPSSDVTREELAEALASISYKRETETFGAYDRRRADALLARYQITRRAS